MLFTRITGDERHPSLACLVVFCSLYTADETLPVASHLAVPFSVEEDVGGRSGLMIRVLYFRYMGAPFIAKCASSK